jgi:hypothetical protein
VHRVKRFKWEGNSLLRMWVDGELKVVRCPKQHESLVRYAHKRVGSFWGSIDIQFGPYIILVARDAIASLVICF